MVAKSLASLERVVEFPIPFADSGMASTVELSMPFAYSHRSLPWLFRCRQIMSGLARARSPIVKISSLRSSSTLDFPHIYKEETGRGHIFCSISLRNNVCTKLGFLKSDAILASTLQSLIPIFTVNPMVLYMVSLICVAAAMWDS